ncbi:MAG: hypothetical protein DMF63_10710 [Acidobacteria bacterium]|nr:MAG: hypothetical protein DMF63_10710 [Acidobacteriota bacterium]
MPILTQLYWLLILSLVVASISWTVTQEKIFEEWREAAAERSKSSHQLLVRKFFYVWTCEYCFSHWVTILVLLITQFQVLFDDWRGYFLAFFILPWIANFWMSLYRMLRVDIKHGNALAEQTITENEETKG